MLFKFDEKQMKVKEKVKRVTLAEIGATEKDLENIISENIDSIIYSNDLMHIFSEKKGQEAPDIMALDKNGNLYIFELKRWGAKSENLLQVLRYAQMYGSDDYDDLNEMFRKNRKNDSLELFSIHQQYFDLLNPLEKIDFNKEQHLVLVVNGMDYSTIESISYWKRSGLKIYALVYWLFEINKEYFIEFNMFSPVAGYIETDSSGYIANTNLSYSSTDSDDMIKNRKVSAYGGHCYKINQIQKGDTVFLYENGTGIIAYGKASGKVEIIKSNDEYFQKLNEFVKLATPLNYASLNKICERRVGVRGTLISLGQDEPKKIIQYIKEKRLEKN